MDVQVVKQQYQKQLAQLKEQLSSNPRLLFSVWLLVFVLLLQPIWWMQELVSEYNADFVEASQRRVQLTDVSGDEIWVERAKQTQQKMQNLLLRFGQAPSSGVASTTLESWVNPILKAIGLKDPRLKLNEPIIVADVNRYVIVGVEIRGQYEGGQLLELLSMIESYSKLLTVESLDVRIGRRNTFRLVVNGYFLIDQGKEQDL